jgi:hypothetical protein
VLFAGAVIDGPVAVGGKWPGSVSLRIRRPFRILGKIETRSAPRPNRQRLLPEVLPPTATGAGPYWLSHYTSSCLGQSYLRCLSSLTVSETSSGRERQPRANASCSESV